MLFTLIVLLFVVGNDAFYKQPSWISSKMQKRTVMMTKTPTPVCDALLSAAKVAQHRFFFPGHNGGKHAPPQWQALEGTGSLLHYDLPELDELDNIHHPQVIIKIVYFFLSWRMMCLVVCRVV